jgi:response regulator RpfG family c-di-GMP phosphodiesterase
MRACVLVVSDQQDTLELYYNLLESDEYELELSNYTFENLETIVRLSPTLIILDFPAHEQAKGWALLQQLKMHPTTLSIPLILCAPFMKDVWEQEDYLQKQGIVIFYKSLSFKAFVETVHQMV